MTNVVKTNQGMVNVDLSRAAFTITGKGFPKSVSNAVRYCSVELAKRNLERQRPYTVTIGITESLLNIADLGKLAEAGKIPESLIITTLDKAGKPASRRVFRDLQFQFSTNGYAVFAESEVPVVKMIYDCVLEESEYMQVQP